MDVNSWRLQEEGEPQVPVNENIPLEPDKATSTCDVGSQAYLHRDRYCVSAFLTSRLQKRLHRFQTFVDFQP